jgi:hypothetical protein
MHFIIGLAAVAVVVFMAFGAAGVRTRRVGQGGKSRLCVKRQADARLLCHIIRLIVAAPDADAGSMPAPTGGGRPTP